MAKSRSILKPIYVRASWREACERMEDRYLGVVAFAVWILSIICVLIVAPPFVQIYAELTGPALSIILAYYFVRQSEMRVRLGHALEYEVEDTLILIACLLIITLAALATLYYIVPYLPRISQVISCTVRC